MRHLLLLALFASMGVHSEARASLNGQEIVAVPTATTADETSALQVYAVIISGGRSKMFNHERYWNDCAFIYRTLRQDYDIPKDRITLLMADGDNPANDILCDGATGFASSATDLDGDGQPDLILAATRKNVDDTFQHLSTRLTSCDHLFIFITDHGERDADGSVHLWLWGSEQLIPDELAAMVAQCHPATMNILLGQCHAGAFIAPLQAEGRVITAACTADQMSWSCKDRCYDEFVYHWTCAIAGHDETGLPVNADTDGNGHVSMQEAYDYASEHDRRPETPSITARPSALFARWSFSDVTESVGITSIDSESTANDHYYDLQGRRIK